MLVVAPGVGPELEAQREARVLLGSVGKQVGGADLGRRRVALVREVPGERRGDGGAQRRLVRGAQQVREVAKVGDLCVKEKVI